LFNLVASADGNEVCVCDLVEPLGRSQPTVSHHMKVLAEAGLVVGEKRGRWVWYRVVRERVREVRGVLA
jgi:ArsR family transcriptional regulator